MFAQQPTPFTSAYATRGKAAALSPAATKQLALFSARVQNRGGSTIDVGLLRRLNANKWKLFTTVAGTVAEKTSTIQAGSVVTLFTTTNNDGIYIQSSRRFGFFGFTVSQAETGSPVYAPTYWNGSSFTALTVLSFPTAYSAADQFHAFLPPADWVVGGHASLDQNMYAIRLLATTAPSQAVIANAGWAGEWLKFAEGVADNGTLELLCPPNQPITLDDSEGLMPYFGTANAANLIEALYANV